MTKRLLQLLINMTQQEQSEVEIFAAFVIVRRNIQTPLVLNDDISSQELMQLVVNSGGYIWLDVESWNEGIKEGLKDGKKEGIKEGKKAGIQEAISLGLELKFGIESLSLMDKVNKIGSIRKLEMLKEAIKKVNNVDEISKLLSK